MVIYIVVAVQSLSCVWLLATPWTAAHQSSLSSTISEFAQTHVHLVNDAIQPSYPLLHPSPALNLFQHGGFPSELTVCIRCPKYWSFSFNISPSDEYSRLISFRIYWFDLLAVQSILKSLLQYHSLKASILRCSAFFIVQLSHPYKTIGKTVSLPIQTLSAKWCLCFSTCCLGLL